MDSYQKDEKAMAIMKQLAIQPASKPPYSLVNGLLEYKQSIWVGPVPALHQKFFAAFHDSPLGAFRIPSYIQTNSCLVFLVGYEKVHSGSGAILFALSES